VDRSRLWEELRRMGFKEDLIRGAEKIYEETEVKVQTSQEFTRNFRTTKGVKQGCDDSTLV